MIERECRKLTLPQRMTKKPPKDIFADMNTCEMKKTKPFFYHGRDIIKENKRQQIAFQRKQNPTREVSVLSKLLPHFHLYYHKMLLFLRCLHFQFKRNKRIHEQRHQQVPLGLTTKRFTSIFEISEVPALRASLYSSDNEKRKTILKLITRVTQMEPCGLALVPYYRQLLPPLRSLLNEIIFVFCID
uniref:Uncharacterized protein n=1 Tax=Parascaris equorum TaxID=6256 RepID=A0A914RWB9_PAREQ